MKSIQAARIDRYGGAEAVQLQDMTLDPPKAGELLVRVYAAGLNPLDWKLRSGFLRKSKPLHLPVTLGGDFSGVIEAVGPGVKDLSIGDAVYGQASPTSGGSGSFAEMLIAPAGTTSLKPKTVSHAEAAVLPLSGVSALQALTEQLRVAAGRSLLIHGGAGGIGSMAIQIAKDLGAEVATTVSGRDAEFAHSLGADVIVDYKTQRFEDVVSELDAIFDTVGGDTYARSFKVLKAGGRLVSMVEQPREDLMGKFQVEAIAQFTQVTTERLTNLADLVDRGVLKIPSQRRYPLEKVRAALEDLEKKHFPKEKLVLTLVDE